MPDTIQAGRDRDRLTANFTFPDGHTEPAPDAAWAWTDPLSAATVDTASGPTVTVTGIDRQDGSSDTVTFTATAGGFTATFEVDIAASAASPTGLVVTSSGPEPAA